MRPQLRPIVGDRNRRAVVVLWGLRHQGSRSRRGARKQVNISPRRSATAGADRLNDASAHHFTKFGEQPGATVTNRTDTDVRISA